MNRYINRFKIYFMAILSVIIVVAVLIGFGIKNMPYVDLGFLERDLKTLEYKIDFSGGVASFLGEIPQALSKQIQFQRSASALSIPVLVYHGIPNESDHSVTNITVDAFKAHIFALKRAGYNTITTDQLLSYLQGKIKLPDKSIMITFDDGRVDSLNIADPLLNAVGYNAVMFAIGKFSLLNDKNSYYLTLDNLKEMNSSGRWDIEAHSYDGHGTYPTSPLEENGHFFSHKIWLVDKNRLETDEEFQSRVQADLGRVKHDLGNSLGKTISSFAFPYGDFGQNNTNFSQAKNLVLNDTKDLYSLAFYQIAPEIHFTSNYFTPENKDDSFFLVRRININPEWSGDDLINTLKKSEAKPLPYIDDFSQDKGWVKIWSSLDIGNNVFHIYADKDQTGASAILDGSRLWGNYYLTAIANSPHRQGVNIWARFQDENNNVSCNFGRNFIHIEETVNGVKTTIQGVNYKYPIIPSGDFPVEVQVKNKNIVCLLNNSLSVKSTFVNDKLSTGGIGFKTWEETKGQSSLTIKDLQVNEIP